VTKSSPRFALIALLIIALVGFWYHVIHNQHVHEVSMIQQWSKIESNIANKAAINVLKHLSSNGMIDNVALPESLVAKIILSNTDVLSIGGTLLFKNGILVQSHKSTVFQEYVTSPIAKIETDFHKKSIKGLDQLVTGIQRGKDGICILRDGKSEYHLAWVSVKIGSESWTIVPIASEKAILDYYGVRYTFLREGIIGMTLTLLIMLSIVLLLRYYHQEMEDCDLQLRQIVREQQTLHHNIPAFVYYKDLDFRYISVNHMMEDFFGVPESKIIGKTDMSFFSEEDALHFHEDDARVMKSGEALYNIRDLTRRRDGSFIWVSTNKVPLRDEKKGIIGMVGIAWDITELVIAEQQIRDSEEKFRGINEAAQDAILLIDSNGSIQLWNQSAERIFGYKREEIIGSALHSIVANDANSQILNGLLLDYDVESFYRWNGKVVQVNGITKSGSFIPLEAAISCFDLNGSRNGIFIARDITDRVLQMDQLQRAKEQAERANLIKSNFLANMSHEIRTPMNAILGFTSILLNNPHTEEQEEFLHIINKSGESLLKLLNDVLDLSRIEAEKLQMDVSTFSITELIHELKEMFSLHAAEKDIDFSIEGDLNQPSYVIGDPHRIKQVLINLLSNAFKFTDKDGQVSFKWERIGNLTRFIVSDSGIGIPFNKQKDIFNSFEQVDGSYTRKYGGTGLGLAITQSLVTMMQGTITVSSVPKQGSTFTVQIDLPEATQYHINMNQPEEDGHNKQSAKGLMMVQRWLARCSSNQDIELITREAIALLPQKLEALLDRISSEDQERVKYLSYQLVSSSVNLQFDEIAQCANSIFALVEEEDVNWIEVQTQYHRLEDIVSTIPQSYFHIPQVNDLQTNRNIRRILVAEDNHLNQRLMANLLSKLGFDCDVVENGQLAIEQLRQQQYLTLLLDMQMPVMDGMETIKYIRNDKELSDLYVIALTAHAMLGDREKFIALGCDEYLSKPIKIDELNYILQSLIEERELLSKVQQ